MTDVPQFPPDPEVGPMRIGQLARELELTPRTLRYWEERCLLPPAIRTPGGFRLYGNDHLQAARGICRLKRAGFSLDEILEIQGSLGTSTSALAGLTGLSAALAYRERRIRERLQEQQSLLEELQAAQRALDPCTGCDGKSYDGACVTCLSSQAGNTLPDSLVTLMRAAARETDQ